MSVVIETTLGDITVDLFLKERPRACLNFLKLCKQKYYNYNLFHTISRGFIAQTGDPTGSRQGGESIYGVIDGPSKRYFEGEKNPRIKHTSLGLVSFVGNNEGMIGSQFFITLGTDLSYLDGMHCVFGEVMEGLDVIELLNETICDVDNRPYKDVRITHTVILDDPFNDLKDMRIPSRSPSPTPERLQGGRIGADEEIDDTEGKTAQEISEMLAEREAKARATILEMVGDLPDAEMAPPENVLFVCKLNPVTTDDDLEIIFSRFGKIVSCEVIRDRKSGDSLQYAFVEFDNNKSCEDAYFKMDNVLIDDRRIHVDFSQSVSKIKWHGKGRGVTTFDDRGRKVEDTRNDIGKGNYKIKNQEQDTQHRSNTSSKNVYDYRNQSLDGKNNRRDRSSYQNRRDKNYSPERKKGERSPSPYRKKGERSPSPYRKKGERSPSPYRKKGERSPSPYRKKGERSPSPYRKKGERSPSPYRKKGERSPSPYRKKGEGSPSPYKNRRESPQKNRRDKSHSPSKNKIRRYESPYKDRRERNYNPVKNDRRKSRSPYQNRRERSPKLDKNRSTNLYKNRRERSPYDNRKEKNNFNSRRNQSPEQKIKNYDENERYRRERSESPIKNRKDNDRRRNAEIQSHKKSKNYRRSRSPSIEPLRRKNKYNNSDEDTSADEKKKGKKKTGKNDKRDQSSSEDDRKKRKKKNKKKSKRRKDSSSSSEDDVTSSDEDKRTKKKKKRRRSSSSSD